MLKQPNLLFIMSDDHAANAISCYESRLAAVFRTPNLDRIGNEGAKLSHCYCTNAICTPSRATILTGMYAHQNGVRTLADSLDPSLTTFPKIFQKQGYETAIVGKWHLHSAPQGFDYYDVLPGQGLYFDPYFINQQCDLSLFRAGNMQDGIRHQGYVTDIITDKCLDWLQQRDKQKPFLLLCHHKAPHDDFEYHPRDEHLFDGIDIPEPDSLWEDKSHRSVATREYGTTVSEKNARRNAVKTMSSPDYPTGPLDVTGLDAKGRTRKAYQKYLKDYLRVVKGIDDNVGRLIDYLEEEDELDNTIIVYTSDQGMFLGEHDYIDKRWIYEEAMQMPFLIRYPRAITPGLQLDNLISNVDFAPTLLDIVGLGKTDEMQGHSFVPLLMGSDVHNWPERIYYRYWMHMAHHDNPAHYGIRTSAYKLIFFYGLPLDATGALPEPTPAGWELYDLVKDSQELHNVYEDASYKSIVDELMKELFQLKVEVGDTDEQYADLQKLIQDSHSCHS